MYDTTRDMPPILNYAQGNDDLRWPEWLRWLFAAGCFALVAVIALGALAFVLTLSAWLSN